jgi:hypothetical protein
MWRHYVYVHRRADGTPFYVGKGSHRMRDKRPSFERAYTECRRSAAWKEIARSSSLNVTIVAMCRTDQAAQEIERSLIREMGRRDLGLGPLVNVTDGGDGHAGIVASEELRRKRSHNASAPRSTAWVRSIRIARSGGGNGGVVKQGDKLPEDWRASLSASKKGAKNPFYGKPTPISKRVINTSTGAIYASVARAAEVERVNAKTLYQYLDGKRVNRTPLARL